MPTVIPHIGFGGSMTETAEGFTDSAEYFVHGLGPNTDARRARNVAIGAAGIPGIGSRHPSKDIYVHTKTCKLTDDDKAVVTVQYGLRTLPNTPIDLVEKAQIDLSSTVQTAQTNLDAHGELLLLEQEFPPFPAVETEKFFATAQVGVAMQVLTFTQTEALSPGNKSRRFNNKVNAGAVPWDTGPTQKHCWRCNGISGSQSASDGLWTVRYIFQYAEPKEVDGITGGGWDAFLVMLKDGEIREDLTIDNGMKFFEVYNEEDFTNIPGLQL